MSQRPDTHASVNGICANSLNALSTDGERHGVVFAFTMATLFTVGLSSGCALSRDTPAVRATALKVSSSELADAVTKITQVGPLDGQRLRDALLQAAFTLRSGSTHPYVRIALGYRSQSAPSGRKQSLPLPYLPLRPLADRNRLEALRLFIEMPKITASTRLLIHRSRYGP
jgi:hypothetical protein